MSYINIFGPWYNYFIQYNFLWYVNYKEFFVNLEKYGGVKIYFSLISLHFFFRRSRLNKKKTKKTKQILHHSFRYVRRCGGHLKLTPSTPFVLALLYSYWRRQELLNAHRQNMLFCLGSIVLLFSLEVGIFYHLFLMLC